MFLGWNHSSQPRRATTSRHYRRALGLLQRKSAPTGRWTSRISKDCGGRNDHLDQINSPLLCQYYYLMKFIFFAQKKYALKCKLH